MPAAPISIQQNRPALRPSTSESRGGSQTRPRSPHLHPAISLRVSVLRSHKKKRRPVFSGTGTPACTLSTSQSFERVHPSLQPLQSSWFPPASLAAKKKRRPVFSGTGTPACALTTSRPNFEVASIHRCNPSNQAGFLQPPSPQKKTPPSCIWRRVQIPKLVCFPTLPASPCQSTQIDNTHNNSMRSRPSGSSSSCAKSYTRWVNGGNSPIRQYARIWTRVERKDPKQTAGSL